MAILAKLFTAMRGAASDAGEAVVDHQALRILDQEMRDAEKELNEAKSQLTDVMAQKRGVEREVEKLRGKVSEHEDFAVKSTERNIAAMRRQVSMVKATERVQKASAAAGARFSGSNTAMSSATDSLERIKERQQHRSDRMEAASQLTADTEGADLDKRLKDAGIVSAGKSGSDVLDRIRAKRGG